MIQKHQHLQEQILHIAGYLQLYIVVYFTLKKLHFSLKFSNKCSLKKNKNLWNCLSVIKAV